MRWEKQGLLLAPPPAVDWAVSHLMVPVAEADGERLRVWFAARDEAGRSRVGRAVVDVGGGNAEYEPRPVLGLGELGAFDDSGVNASCLVRDGGRVLLYYIGWKRGVSVPFYTGVGAAVSDDGGATFRRISRGPLLPPDDVDPFFTTSPWVCVEDDRWRMWYASCVRWEARPSGPKHWYHVRYAESENGVTWRRTGHVCVDFAGPDEYAIARPCVVKDDDRYRMWFSHRGARYAIGYAESEDGLEWERVDVGLGLEPSGTGWDAEMVEYPFVLDHGGTRRLLYNGNGYGASGIGHAVLADE